MIAALIVGGAIGSVVTLAVHSGPSTTARAAPDIVNALRASAGDDCPDKAPYTLIAPVKAKNGDWYTGCILAEIPTGARGGSIYYLCFRVRSDTLEVVRLPSPTGGNTPESALGTACTAYPNWPKS